MNTMTTVSEVLNELRLRGYTVDFNLDDNCLICHSNSLKIHPQDFVVDKHYRFEGMSDPSDEAIVYAISSPKHDIKGTLVNGYGISSDNITDDLIKALNEKPPVKHLEQLPDSTPTKSNEATPLRPEGERELDAPMVTMDLNLLKAQIKQEDSYKNGDRNAITIFKTGGMRLVLIALHKGAEMKTHTAPGIISVQVLEGHITFTTEQKTAERSAGQMLALHAGIAHKVFANAESLFLLTISSRIEKK
ncbi:cupin domain-containing protein [Dyadobacter sp. CY343]|uniref:cupin domain-containing protein n=1 Tax=Dyadobacter sp. CY343 TaxID=2907299 RepID=UPI001F4024B5|nr:cupin domain-containing protein [Dyadobacter sp. CY343]MCE7063614.1 cupin domain-containing protein [Dyadobacter sp. CY343]